jgi:hypothetical protein
MENGLHVLNEMEIPRKKSSQEVTSLRSFFSFAAAKKGGKDFG